jgi:hypothetical protein
VIRTKNMRNIPIRRRNVAGLIGEPWTPGWACCHSLNASMWERSMSATQLRVVADEEAGEDPQVDLDGVHRRGRSDTLICSR